MAKKEEKKDDYDFKTDNRSIEEKIDEKLQQEEKQREEGGDLHILDIAKNPPEPGYMKVELKKAEVTLKDTDEKIQALGLPLAETIFPAKPPEDPTVFININGDTVQLYDTIFETDLKQMADAQVSDCASTIFPMLIDEAIQLALDEKKARTLEKRKEEFKWWWIVVLMLIMIPILIVATQVLPMILPK
jgi:hypothetical protein